MGRVLLLMKIFSRFANRDSNARLILDDQDVRYQFLLKGEKPFYIIANKAKLKLDTGEIHKPDVVFSTDAKTFFKIFSGELGQDEAFLTKKLDVQGSIMASARFRRMSALLMQSHKTGLRFLRFFIRIIPL